MARPCCPRACMRCWGCHSTPKPCPAGACCSGCPRKSAAMRPRSGKAHCPTSRSSSSTGWCAATASGLKCCSGAWWKPTALAAATATSSSRTSPPSVKPSSASRSWPTTMRSRAWPTARNCSTALMLPCTPPSGTRNRFCCSPSRSIRWTSSSRPWAMARAMPWPWPWHHAFARWPSPATSWRAWTAVNLRFC